MTWAAQAAYLRHEGTVSPIALVREKWFVTHPRYPLLLPVAQVAVQEVAVAGPDEQPFRALYAAFYPVLLLLVWDGARRRAGGTAAGAVLAVAPVPLLSFVGEGRAAGAYSDLPLACFYGAGLLLLLRPRLRPLDGLAAGVLLAGAALAKNEGALLAPAALLLAALYRARPWRHTHRGAPRRRLSRALAPVAAAALPVLAALLLLASWRAGIPNRHDEGYRAPRPGPPALGARRAAASARPIALEKTFLSPSWGTFWWMAAVVLAAGWSGIRRRRGAVLAAAAAAPLAVGWLACSVHWDPATRRRHLGAAAPPGAGAGRGGRPAGPPPPPAPGASVKQGARRRGRRRGARPWLLSSGEGSAVARGAACGGVRRTWRHSDRRSAARALPPAGTGQAGAPPEPIWQRSGK